MRRSRRILAGFVFLALIAGACERGTGPGPAPELFDRYVALGNSITAGYESEGINDSTQMNSYAVLLAQRTGASFALPRLQRPGCPPPLVGPAPLTGERVGGASELTCAGLVLPLPIVVQNLSFPGFKIADALSVPGGTTGILYNLVFQGRTLVQAMVAAQPTLVSMWLGNNDALSAGLNGDPALLTPLASFQASLNAVAGALAQQTPAQDAILIGVTDPQSALALQPGAYYWAVTQDPLLAPLLPKPVNANCAPLTPTGAPNPLATNLVSLLIKRDPAVAEISCANDAPYLLNPSEQQAIATRVAEFNAALQAAAQARGWIYLDANELIRSQLADPDGIRNCQGLPTASTAQEFAAAVINTCPHPNAPNFFGSLVSYDGVHPSRAGQQLIADEMAAALRTKHGIALSVLR